MPLPANASELDRRLDHHLERLRALGVVDIKCTFGGNTTPTDFKKVMVSVFDREERGELRSIPLSSLGSFDEFYAQLQLK